MALTASLITICDSYSGHTGLSRGRLGTLVFNDGKACDSANLVGSCLKHGKVSRYFTANLKSQTMKELQSDCESGFSEGHWYQGPNAPADKPAAAPAGKGAAKTGAPAAKPKGKK